jgi:hypothetical protein
MRQPLANTPARDGPDEEARPMSEEGLETYDAEVERAAEDSVPLEAASFKATAPLLVPTLQPTSGLLREVEVVFSTNRRKV